MAKECSPVTSQTCGVPPPGLLLNEPFFPKVNGVTVEGGEPKI